MFYVPVWLEYGTEASSQTSWVFVSGMILHTQHQHLSLWTLGRAHCDPLVGGVYPIRKARLEQRQASRKLFQQLALTPKFQHQLGFLVC